MEALHGAFVVHDRTHLNDPAQFAAMAPRIRAIATSGGIALVAEFFLALQLGGEGGQRLGGGFLLAGQFGDGLGLLGELLLQVGIEAGHFFRDGLDGLHLALKSGNFGGLDFFRRAFASL